MRYHYQNLNEAKGKVIGSVFWRGRAWFYLARERHKETFHAEWMFGKYARDFAITATFGYGDSDSGVCLHICIPWLFSVFLVVPHAYRCRESQTGIGIHNGAFWVYPLTDQHESRHDHPWWKKNYAFYFPWTLKHRLTEVLEHKANLPYLQKTVWTDAGKKMMGSWEERKKAQASVTEVYDYEYALKNGEVQQRRAAVFVERMTWVARWYPLIPIKKVSTAIDVSFNKEVGEGEGSWKGGCLSCGYDMSFGETPLETLRRMERERKFTR